MDSMVPVLLNLNHDAIWTGVAIMGHSQWGRAAALASTAAPDPCPPAAGASSGCACSGQPQRVPGQGATVPASRAERGWAPPRCAGQQQLPHPPTHPPSLLLRLQRAAGSACQQGLAWPGGGAQCRPLAPRRPNPPDPAPSPLRPGAVPAASGQQRRTVGTSWDGPGGGAHRRPAAACRSSSPESLPKAAPVPPLV
jgi:hypothetical protein